MACFTARNEHVPVRISGKNTCITLGGILLPVAPFLATKNQVLNFLHEGLTVTQLERDFATEVGIITLETIGTVFTAVRVRLTLAKSFVSKSYMTVAHEVKIFGLDGVEIVPVEGELVVLSSNGVIAEVVNGIIELKSAGEVEITATYKDFSGCAKLVVNPSLEVTVSDALVTMEVNSVKVFDFSETTGKLNHSEFEVVSADIAIANVSVDYAARKCTVIGVAEGSTKVVITIKDTDAIAEVGVIVTPVTELPEEELVETAVYGNKKRNK